jgi:chromosome segregation ATPase
MIKVYLFLIIMGVLGSVGYGGYMYYKDTQQRIATLTENNAKLETAIQISEQSVETLRGDITKNAELNRELQKELQVAEQYGDQLRNTLRKHNLTHLANKKPGLIEKRMQNATNRLWNDLTNITDPDKRVQPDPGAKNSDGNTDGKDRSTVSSKTKESPAK